MFKNLTEGKKKKKWKEVPERIAYSGGGCVDKCNEECDGNTGDPTETCHHLGHNAGKACSMP